LARYPGRIVFHHHDLPWQRAELAAIRGLPPDLPGALHVVVNDRSRDELAARGIKARTIRNTFDFDAPAGDRDAARAELESAADVVVFPSTWEGFGNPVIESVVARRPLAVHRYPVLDEILAGVRVFSVDDPGEVAAWLRAPHHALFEANRDVARRNFSLADLPGRLDAAFATNGWTSW